MPMKASPRGFGFMGQARHAARRQAGRSIWNTTGIFIALAVLTGLMALVMYGAIQGVSGTGTSPTDGSGTRTPAAVMRATR